MTKHKMGTKWSREYKGKKVQVKLTKAGYMVGTKAYKSLTAATKEGIGTATPPSIFFGGTKTAKRATKGVRIHKTNNSASVEVASTNLESMVNDAVQRKLTELVDSAVSSAVERAFRSGDSH